MYYCRLSVGMLSYKNSKEKLHAWYLTKRSKDSIPRMLFDKTPKEIHHAAACNLASLNGHIETAVYVGCLFPSLHLAGPATSYSTLPPPGHEELDRMRHAEDFAK